MGLLFTRVTDKTIGILLSLTVMVKDALLVLPAVSIAEQETVVTPNGKVSPE